MPLSAAATHAQPRSCVQKVMTVPTRRLHERVRERACELVDGFPAGAVRRKDSAYFCGDKSIDCRLDDRFEDAAREV